MAKTHVGILEVDRETSLPNLRSDKGGFGFEGTSPKYWNGSSWSAFSGASGGVGTWDELYDLDKSMTVDSTGITWASTSASGDLFTLNGGVTTTGDLLQFDNAGSGSDVKGTSDTWSVSKAGAAVFTGIVMGDDEALTLGDSSDATIAWNGTVLNIAGVTDFDNNVTLAANATITQAGVAGSTVFTITAGDAVMSDASLAITDADNAATLTVTNATVTTANPVTITADAETTGSIVYIDNGGASLTTGFYINCNDDGVSDFSVGADGATKIVTAVATTDALHVSGVQTSQDMVTFDNTGGVIASDKAVLLLDAGGNVADGGNMLRLAPTGTPVAGSIGIEFVGAGKVMQGLYIDSDPTAGHVAHIHGGGALTDGKAVLALTNDGNLASGGNLLNVTVGGTPNAAAIAVEIAGATKALTALSVDSDPTASSTAVINGGGALTNGYAVLHVSSDGNLASGGNTLKVSTAGTPASGAMYAEFDFTGITDTNENVGVKIDAGGKKVIGLHVDGDPIANSLAYFHTDGVIAADKAVVEINGEASADNADSAILRVEQGATDGVANVIALKQDDVSEPFISFETTIGTGNAIQAVAALNLTATHYIMVDIEGVGKRYLAVGTLA